MPIDIEAGVAALKSYLGPLAAAELKPAKLRSGEMWAFTYPLPEDYLDIARTLRIGFREGFPGVPLDFAITPSAWLAWPHVMQETLCLFSDGRRPSAASPEAAVHSAMARAAALVEFSMPDTDPAVRRTEFVREIRTYWDHQLETATQPLMLVGLPPNSAELFVLSGASYNMMATEANAITHFEKRQGGRSGALRAPAKAAFYLTLVGTPPVEVPPPTIGALRKWLQGVIAEQDSKALDAWLANTTSFASRWIVFRLPDTEAATWALYIGDAALKKNKSRAYSRRAARKLPPPTTPASARRVHLARSELHVLDAEIAHSRNLGAARSLFGKRVVLVGCGSLGSECAMQLARAGVGHIVLVDYDTLKVENLGRHVLGIRDLGQYKAEGLRRILLNAVPDLSVSALNQSAQAHTTGLEQALAAANLVLVTTADWASELALWRRKVEAGMSWTMVQSWSEPHARAGHALVSPTGHGSAEHLFDEQGRFRKAFTSWPDDGVVSLPACGESFVPGDAVRITTIANLAVQASVAALSDQNCPAAWHYVVSDVDDIGRLGGTYHGPPLSPGVRVQAARLSWDALA